MRYTIILETDNVTNHGSLPLKSSEKPNNPLQFIPTQKWETHYKNVLIEQYMSITDHHKLKYA